MKRAVLSFVVVAALATSASATEDGCTAFVVGKKASATGCPFKDAPPAYFATGAAAERLYEGRLFRTSPTPGWENVNPKRREFPPVKVVWRAPVAS